MLRAGSWWRRQGVRSRQEGNGELGWVVAEGRTTGIVWMTEVMKKGGPRRHRADRSHSGHGKPGGIRDARPLTFVRHRIPHRAPRPPIWADQPRIWTCHSRSASASRSTAPCSPASRFRRDGASLALPPPACLHEDPRHPPRSSPSEAIRVRIFSPSAPVYHPRGHVQSIPSSRCSVGQHRPQRLSSCLPDA
ncbi:hypothetical protein OBBRIDRAFT_984 [Obba rivulosa]|uniref:Uncharacterized protein n=1 Tax=Obba rivulosa TaxID=1052685 RepID=A0A8E2J7A3_9APHY|nr:hypothetical protein OBBRIDRAFT_984 [Obba rivulosa]